MEDTLIDTLAPAQAALWRDYLAAEAQGLRAGAMATLRAFVAALQDGPAAQRQAFATEFCRLVADEGVTLPRRVPLFAGVLAPYLLSAYERGEEQAGRRLAFFRDRFWSLPLSHPLRRSAPSTLYLLREAFQQNPADASAREMLLGYLRDQFRYAIHEVPAGVLYGFDGATVAQCWEWEEDLAFFRAVAKAHGVTAQYEADIHEWTFHFHGYADYLTHRTEYEDYADYIERHTQA